MRTYFGDKTYDDTLLVKSNNGGFLHYPVYARDNGSEYVEILTGTPIPKVIDDEAPGFGAYKVEVVVTKSELTNAANYMKWILESHLKEYTEALENSKKDLESVFDKFKEKHFDRFGRLSEPNPEREPFYQNELDKARENVSDIVSEMIKGGKQFKK